MIKDRAKKEFEMVLKRYILPLFDIKGNLKLVDNENKNTQLITTSKTTNELLTINFYPCISTKNHLSPFHFCVKTYSNESLKKRAISILSELLKVTEYNYRYLSKQRDYGKNEIKKIAYKNITLDLAFEFGMCKWLTASDEDAYTLHKLICRMIEWSCKTYEGKNVPFGIIIDFDKSSNEMVADYIQFLENDSSAVFSDGVFSGIYLDKKGKVLSFLTKENSSFINTCQEIFVPYQYNDIAKLCIGNAIGIIALTNGEILLVKDQAICFAKRGQKWISFDWMRVYLSLRPYFLLSSDDSNQKEIENKIKKIYCTLLDVSFSHTGGCLALVIPSESDGLDDVIKERIDLFAQGFQLKEISKESSEKIEILTYLLTCQKKKLSSFYEIEKPLRKEILSLDGATVVTLDGEFYCAGSIVAVSGGSSGGGRTAATKSLAKYGVGIKISEDGYIEAYGKNLLSDKPRFNPLFKIK